MADRMDELLHLLGQEANEQVDFEAAFADVLAKAQAAEQAACPTPAQKWKRAWLRAMPVAAGMVVVLGLALLLNGLYKDLTVPKSEAPELAMSAAESDAQAAPAPAAMFSAPEAAEDRGAGIMAQPSLTEESPFYAAATITVPAAGSACGKVVAESNSQPTPGQTLLNGTHDAYDAEGGICFIGEAPRPAAIEKLAALGYEACPSSDAHVDQLAVLQPGEACIAPSGEIGVWNTGDGFLTLANPALSQMDLFEILLQAL
ncbi:MAG: hypothetical protein EOM66_00305 [Clostridia bacterium]|nr:hypothetical protein [Clostridia bacterium]